MEESKVKIIAKIKNLMELAQDNPSDEEGQTALLMAQKLMLKHDIHLSQVETHDEPKKFETGVAVGKSGKRVAWWEKDMSIVIATNFRCYVINQRNPYLRTSEILFFGEKEDSEMAAKIYESALMYIRYRLKRLPIKTPEFKNSYLMGFISSLQERFEKQVEEFGLMILPKKEVLEELQKEFTNLSKAAPKVPDSGFDQEGYDLGKEQGANARILPDEILGEED